MNITSCRCGKMMDVPETLTGVQFLCNECQVIDAEKRGAIKALNKLKLHLKRLRMNWNGEKDDKYSWFFGDMFGEIRKVKDSFLET